MKNLEIKFIEIFVRVRLDASCFEHLIEIILGLKQVS